MTINPQLNDEVKSIQEQYSGEVLAADYFRYNVQQTKLELTISQSRKPDIFEEFVLQSAINMNNPSTDVEEIANMLCIDPMLISKTTKKLENYGSLAVNSDSKIHVNYSAQELFINSCLILQPTCTKDAYYINDPFAGSKINKKVVANIPQSLFSLNDYQDNLLEINDKYKEVESLVLSEIKDIIDYSDLQITDTQEVTRFQVIDNRIEGSKKVSIFVIQTNKIQFLIEEQELKYLSDTLTQLSEEGKLDWQDLFSQRQTTTLYPSALIRSDTTEAQGIKSFVEERGIEYLVHFTSIENLSGICRERAILSLTKLRELNCPYNQIDNERIDRQLQYIFCSVTYYNFLYHYLISSKSSCWVLLHIRTDYMWKNKTQFCTTNAATDGGAHLGRGLDKLQNLFAPQVFARRGIQTRFNKPENLPTNIQAEVLVYESISLEDVIKIVVKNRRDVEQVRGTGWEGEIEIRPDLFQPRFDWI
jgi:hypothetical protein